MPSNLVSDRPPLISLLRILSMVLIGFVLIGPFFGVAVASLLYGVDFLTHMSDPLGHPDIKYAILLSQGIASTVGLILLPAFYLYQSERKKLSPFFYNEPSWLVVIPAVAAGVIGVAVAISPVVEWNMNIQFPESMAAFGNWVRSTETLAANIIKSITANLTPSSFAVTLLVVAVIAAFGEEFVFRGLIQNEMTRAVRNPHLAIWLTAIFFSAFHLQFLGFFPRVLLGAFLGYLYYWSGNLWIPILAHFLNNGIQVVGLYLYQQGIISTDIESTESAPWKMVGIAIVLTGVLFVFYKNYFLSRSTSIRGFTQEL
ncbi:MAG TPA: CPBP family intramembrane metalloprotease [Cyclobacteriaceae bacterium]|nr:CPBP family intramembrane metalloprotease [Cyclobacteriaceae bacterium]